VTYLEAIKTLKKLIPDEYWSLRYEFKHYSESRHEVEISAYIHGADHTIFKNIEDAVSWMINWWQTEGSAYKIDMEYVGD